MLYDEGRGVARDDAEAARLYSRAAARNEPLALYGLAAMRADGSDVPRDEAGAAELYCRAAEQGHAFAQNSLGVAYAKAQGVPRDFVEAHKWFSIAARQGNEQAQKNADALAQIMTPQQRGQSSTLAAFVAKVESPASQVK